MREETRKILQDFIEQAEYIESSSYVSRGENIVSISATKDEEGKFITEFDMPTREQRDAMLLTLRLFIIGRDRISIRELEKLKNDDELSNYWFRCHEHYRKELNIKLDQEASSNPKTGKLTFKHILEIYMWGKKAHLDEEKRKIYDILVYDETSELLFEHQFHVAAIYLINAVLFIAECAKKELERNQSQ